MLETIQSLAQIYWLLPLLVGITAFLESLAVVGVIVPGVVILTALATLAGQEDFSVWILLLAGFIGAWLGDSLSFFFGYKYKSKIVNWKIFQNSQNLFKKGELFFANYGIASIVIGRFVGPIRPFIPIIAGIMAMNPIKFISINSISAIFWSPAYLLPGYFLGKGLKNIWLPPNSVFVLSFVLGIFIIATFSIGYLRKNLGLGGSIYTKLENKLSTTKLWQISLSLNKKEVPLAQFVLVISSFAGYFLAYFALDLDIANIAQNFHAFLASDQVWINVFVNLTNFIYAKAPYGLFLAIWILYLIWQKQYKLAIVFALANPILGSFVHIVLEITYGNFIEYGLALYIFLFGSIASFNASFVESNKRHLYYGSALVVLFLMSLGVIFSASFSFLEVAMTWFLSLFFIGIFNLFLTYRNYLNPKKTYNPTKYGFLTLNIILLLAVILHLNLLDKSLVFIN